MKRVQMREKDHSNRRRDSKIVNERGGEIEIKIERMKDNGGISNSRIVNRPELTV